jgi:crotonobetainyl-CoA:carnitine CoA-transferase CaiB-like acyl-CoA transferase
LSGLASPDECSTFGHVQPLAGLLVVDLTRYLPGPFASRELLRLGARAVRLQPPGGDPLRELAPAWHEALNAGKESVEIDLKAEPERGLELCAQADVVLESFRPGVVERLGIGPGDLPATVYCSITGFGPADLRAGHDLNYQGWAGLLADTAPAMPPVQVADLAAGALGAVTQILAALLERERTGRGAHLTISLAHGAHELAAHRLGGEPFPRLLTGGLACYRIYATADGRFLTVAALEQRFFRRLCELLGRPELAARQWDAEQEPLADELAELLAAKPLATWLELFDGEEVSVGPVATLEEAASRFSPRSRPG